VRRLYAGPIKDLTFEQPVRIAAVRLLYTAPPPPDFKVQVDAVMDQGTQSLVPEGFTNPKGAWHQWMLLSTVPTRPAVPAKGLHVTPEKKSLQAMEVWVVAEAAPATR
jgi:hypothetical protein